MHIAPFAAVLIATCAIVLPGQRHRTRPNPLARYQAMLASSDLRQQWRAVRGFTALGQPAIPKLLDFVKERTREKSRQPALAARALARMEERAVDAIPDLLTLVRGGTFEQKMLAIRILGCVAPFAPKQVAITRRTIVDELCSDQKERAHRQLFAGPALARLARDPKKVDTDDLFKDIASRDATRRIQAAQWLVRRSDTTKKKKVTIERLRRALQETQPRNTVFEFHYREIHYQRVVHTHRAEVVQQELAAALLQLTKDLPLEAWLALVNHPDPAIRQESTLALGATGKARAVPALIHALTDRDEIVVWEAITALGMLESKARSARRALEALARGDDKGRAVRARAALRRILGT